MLFPRTLSQLPAISFVRQLAHEFSSRLVGKAIWAPRLEQYSWASVKLRKTVVGANCQQLPPHRVNPSLQTHVSDELPVTTQAGGHDTCFLALTHVSRGHVTVMWYAVMSLCDMLTQGSTVT